VGSTSLTALNGLICADVLLQNYSLTFTEITDCSLCGWQRRAIQQQCGQALMPAMCSSIRFIYRRTNDDIPTLSTAFLVSTLNWSMVTFPWHLQSVVIFSSIESVEFIHSHARVCWLLVNERCTSTVILSLKWCDVWYVWILTFVVKLTETS